VISEVDYVFICLQYDVQAQEWNMIANDDYSDSSSTSLETSFFRGCFGTWLSPLLSVALDLHSWWEFVGNLVVGLVYHEIFSSNAAVSILQVL